MNNKPRGNRRVLRLAPQPKPSRKNIRNVDSRRAAMNAFVGMATLALAALSSSAGVCSAAIYMNEQGVSWLIVSSVILVGMIALIIGSASMLAAIKTWSIIEMFDEKSRARNELLASVIQRPTEHKLEVPFHDWMQ